jgi:hypothetical protein
MLLFNFDHDALVVLVIFVVLHLVGLGSLIIAVGADSPVKK